MDDQSSSISMASSTSSGSNVDDILVLTGEEILRRGLMLLGWSERKLARASRNRHAKHTHLFICDFGANPHVVAEIFSDLQTTDIAAVKIDDATIDDLENLLFALQFLKVYPTEGQRQNKWHQCDRVLRDNCWDILLRLQALKATKIVWPTDAEIGDNIWIGTVDGTHVKTQEPNHPDLPKDPKAFSYKNKAAGLSYEIAVLLWDSRIIWINGPFPASSHDATIFAAPGGLKEKLQGSGVKLIADRGYGGHSDTISTMNAHDSPEVSNLKTRARLRQESVNSKIKTLRITDSARFRHRGVHTDGQLKFKICFEAAVVVTQYKMEINEPLFDV
jgi:DDE superfamily endonuclease